MKCHWLDDQSPLSADALAAEGIMAQSLNLDDFAGDLAALRTARGYVAQDEISLSPDTAGLDAICAKFDREHHHEDDEVRFILEGAGIFDIRNADDRWMRVVVHPGDLIVVPAGRLHRFFLTADKTIRALRLFKDASGWTPVYRDAT